MWRWAIERNVNETPKTNASIQILSSLSYARRRRWPAMTTWSEVWSRPSWGSWRPQEEAEWGGGNDEDVEIDTVDVSFDSTFSKLSFAYNKPKDRFSDIPDANAIFAQQIDRLFKGKPGHYPNVVQQYLQQKCQQSFPELIKTFEMMLNHYSVSVQWRQILYWARMGNCENENEEWGDVGDPPRLRGDHD